MRVLVIKNDTPSWPTRRHPGSRRADGPAPIERRRRCSQRDHRRGDNHRSSDPDDIIDFVLDLERYRQADHKIGRVGAIERHGTTGTARFAGRLRGLPGPSLHDHRHSAQGARAGQASATPCAMAVT